MVAVDKSTVWKEMIFPIYIILFTLCLGHVCGLNCTKIGRCSCLMDDGSGFIDLRPIANTNGTARFRDIPAPDNYSYSFNPCYPFEEEVCKNVAVCQKSMTSYYAIASADSAKFSYDGINFHLIYTDEINYRKTGVTLICDRSIEASLKVEGEVAPQEYLFLLTSKWACPGA